MYDVELKGVTLDLTWEIAAQRFLLAGRRLAALLSKANFNPAQPRVQQAMRTVADGRIRGLQPTAPAGRASTKPAHGAAVRSRSE